MKRGMKVWFKIENKWRCHYIIDAWIRDEGDRSIIAIKKKNSTILEFDFLEVKEIRTPRKVGIRGAPTYVKISDLAFLLHHQLY